MAKRNSGNGKRNDVDAGSDPNGTGVDGDNATVELDGNAGIATEDDRGTESDNDGDGTEFVNPTTTTTGDSGSAAGAGTGKRRGRKPGTKNKPRGTSATQATADLSGMLFTIHMVMAKMVKSELMQITKEESEELSAAITRVTQLYDIRLLDEKTWAFINLALVMGNIYGTRLMVVSLETKRAKNNVVDMPIAMA